MFFSPNSKVWNLQKFWSASTKFIFVYEKQQCKTSETGETIVKQVQSTFGLTSLKLLKAVVTQWLSHGKVVSIPLTPCTIGTSLCDACNFMYIYHQTIIFAEKNHICQWCTKYASAVKNL